MSYSQPRYAGDGVYYEQTRYHQPARRVHVRTVNPVVYPYWSLDYFYFSRHYHPYSVLVHRHDPWFYPYPGWYYGYRPAPRSRVSFGFSYYYPWYSYGSHYHHYHPWRPATRFNYWHYRSSDRHRYSSHDRVRQVDRRLRELQRRQALAARTDRRGRGPTSGMPPRAPAATRLQRQSTSPGFSRSQQQRIRDEQRRARHREAPSRDAGVAIPDVRLRQPRQQAPVEHRQRSGKPAPRDRSSSPPPRSSRSAPPRSRSGTPPQRRSSPPPRSRSGDSQRSRSSSERERSGSSQRSRSGSSRERSSSSTRSDRSSGSTSRSRSSATQRSSRGSGRNRDR